MKATSIWQKNVQSIVNNERGHEITLDLPPGKEGDDTGATALELTVLGLAGCLTTIYAMIAKNSKLEFSGLKAECAAETDEEGMNILEVKCLVTVVAADKKMAKKVFEKTLATCPVGNLFHQAKIKLTENLKII